MQKHTLICIAVPNDDKVVLHQEDRTVIRTVPLIVFEPPPKKPREDILRHYIRYGYSYSERRKRTINTPIRQTKCDYAQTFEKVVQALEKFFINHQND